MKKQIYLCVLGLLLIPMVVSGMKKQDHTGAPVALELFAIRKHNNDTLTTKHAITPDGFVKSTCTQIVLPSCIYPATIEKKDGKTFLCSWIKETNKSVKKHIKIVTPSSALVKTLKEELSKKKSPDDITLLTSISKSVGLEQLKNMYTYNEHVYFSITEVKGDFTEPTTSININTILKPLIGTGLVLVILGILYKMRK